MTVIVMVAGFDHDPAAPEHNAARSGGAYDVWSKELTAFRTSALHWYSGRLSFRGKLRALFAGYWNTYAYGYSFCAPRAAARLLAWKSPPPVDVICHSLGSRVALSAVFAKPHRFRRVLILNGAEGSDIAETVIRACPSVEFLNICVKDDGILKTMGGAFEPRLGYHGCMGRDGVAVMAPNYREIFLDDPETQSAVLKAFAVGVEGDDPSEWADHHYSFLHSPNWKLYRIFFEKGLAGLKALD